MKLFLYLSLLTSFSSLAKTCEVVEVRKIETLYKVRFNHEFDATSFEDCLEQGSSLLGRENDEFYRYTRRSLKSSHRRKYSMNAHMTTVKVVMKYGKKKAKISY